MTTTAQAWDEGFRAGIQHAYTLGDTSPINPYSQPNPHIAARLATRDTDPDVEYFGDMVISPASGGWYPFRGWIVARTDNDLPIAWRATRWGARRVITHSKSI